MRAPLLINPVTLGRDPIRTRAPLRAQSPISSFILSQGFPTHFQISDWAEDERRNYWFPDLRVPLVQVRKRTRQIDGRPHTTDALMKTSVEVAGGRQRNEPNSPKALRSLTEYIPLRRQCSGDVHGWDEGVQGFEGSFSSDQVTNPEILSHTRSSCTLLDIGESALRYIASVIQ